MCLIQLAGLFEKTSGRRRVPALPGCQPIGIVLCKTRKFKRVGRNADKRGQVFFIRNQVAEEDRALTLLKKAQRLLHIRPELVAPPVKQGRSIRDLLVARHDLHTGLTKNYANGLAAWK